MSITLRDVGFLARVSLLLAAFAYFVGGVAGPGAHAHWIGSGAAAVVPEPDSGAPAPEGERGCFVCQILGAAGLPAVAVRLPDAPVRVAVSPLPLPQSTSHREPAPARARAPPPLRFL